MSDDACDRSIERVEGPSIERTTLMAKMFPEAAAFVTLQGAKSDANAAWRRGRTSGYMRGFAVGILAGTIGAVAGQAIAYLCRVYL